jgi:hypothetical protein
MATELGGLVDAESGLISSRIFIEPEFTSRSWRGSSPTVDCF